MRSKHVAEHVNVPRKGSNLPKEVMVEKDNASTSQGEVVRQKRRATSGKVAKRQAIKLQRSTDTVLAKLPFQRMVREVSGKYRSDLRISPGAMDMLQLASENYIHHALSGAYKCSKFNKNVTLMADHIDFFREIGQDVFLRNRIDQ